MASKAVYVVGYEPWDVTNGVAGEFTFSDGQTGIWAMFSDGGYTQPSLGPEYLRAGVEFFVSLEMIPR